MLKVEKNLFASIQFYLANHIAKENDFNKSQ